MQLCWCARVCVCVEPGGVPGAGSCSLLSWVSSATWAACLNKLPIPKKRARSQTRSGTVPKTHFSLHYRSSRTAWWKLEFSSQSHFYCLQAAVIIREKEGVWKKKEKKRKSGKPCGRRSVSKSRHHGVTQFKLVGVNVAADWTWQTSPELPCLISQPCFVEANLSPIIWQGVFYFKHCSIRLGLHVSCFTLWKVFL